MADKSLAVRTPAQSLGLEQMMVLADQIVKSGRFASDTTVAQAIVKIQAGKELGIQPIQAMNNINIIQGRVSLGAGLIAALIKASNKYDYRIIEHTDKICSIEFYDLNGVVLGPKSIFTIEDAQVAGLTGKSVWKQYPKNMLFSRALTNGARWYTPDVFGGPIYTPDELEYEDDLKDISFADFVKAVKDELGETATEDVIKDKLKGQGYSWSVSSKREMLNFMLNSNAFDADYIVIE